MSPVVGKKPICNKCGCKEFKLERTIKDQLIAECSKCGYPHVIELWEGRVVFYDPQTEDLTVEDDKKWKEEEEEEAEAWLKKHKKEREAERDEELQEIKQKSVEELTDELVKFITEEAPKGARFGVMAPIFWRKKGLRDSFFMGDRDPDIELKRLKVESNVKQKMGYEGSISPDQLRKEKELLEVHGKKILEKAKKDGLQKLTEDDIELYFVKIGEAVPRRLVRLLHRSVNLELMKLRER